MKFKVNDRLNVPRTTWSALPAGLLEVAKLAFPNRRSPKSIPDEKWEQIVVAFETWHYVFFSDHLFYRLPPDDQSHDKMQHYLTDIVSRIAAED